MTEETPPKPENKSEEAQAGTQDQDQQQFSIRKRDVGYAFYKAFRRLTQAILVFIIIGLIAVSALWLRLQSGPIDLTFAKDKIVSLVNEQLGEYQIDMNELSLAWLNVHDPFVIETNNLKVFKNDTLFTTIKNIKVGLSPTSMAQAKVRPSFLKITNPEIVLVHKNNQLKVCCVLEEPDLQEMIVVESDENPLENKKLSKPMDIRALRTTIQTIFDDILNNNLTGQYAFFQQLKEVQFDDAALLLIEGQEEAKSFAIFDLTLREGNKSLLGSLTMQLNNEGQPGNIKTTIVYRGEQKDITFMGNVNNISSDIFDKILIENKAFTKQDITMSGDITAAFNEEWKLSLAQLDINIPKGTLILDPLGEKPISIKDVILKSYYNREKEALNIEQLSGYVNDINLTVKADGTRKLGNIILPVLIEIPSIAMTDISDFIPEQESRESALSWPKTRLTQGVIKDFTASFDFAVTRNKETKKRETSFSNIKSKFAFENMTVDYYQGLEPAANSNGTAIFEDNDLLIESTSANIKDIIASKVVVDLDGLTAEGVGKASIDIEAKGPLKTALDYISNEPIGVKEVGFNKQNASGQFDSTIAIDFPLKKDINANEFDVNVKAVLSEANLPDVVSGLPITGGPFDFSYNAEKILVSGTGKLASRPITFKWDQDINLDIADLTADVVTDDGLRKAFGVDLEEYISGPIPINLKYKSIKDKQTFDVNGNITEAKITLEPVSYTKVAGINGTVALKGLIQNNILKEIDGLTINAENLSLNNGRILFTNTSPPQPLRGELKDVSINGNNFSAEFESANNILKLIVRAGLLDANPFFAGEKTNKIDVAKADVVKDKTRPRQISIEADKLLLKNDITANKAKIYISTDSNGKLNSLEMDALIGEGKTVIRYKPSVENMNNSIFLEASDAGQFLKSVGIYKSIKGGFLSIKGQPINNTANIAGIARIDDFRIKDAPVIAKLINTMSLTGILNLLSNEGLSFTRLESDFEWNFRPQGDLIIFKDGRSSGASLGLTFSGLINRETKAIDLAGNIIPMSEVNNLIGDIPLIGNILTGGDALLAATYKIEGPIADPKVTVNPLAALAPGFLRKILFEENVEKKIENAK